jgi:hypothetical protein
MHGAFDDRHHARAKWAVLRQQVASFATTTAARRGDSAVAVTPSDMRADLEILDKVAVADRPIATGGSPIVQAGRAGSHSD